MRYFSYNEYDPDEPYVETVSEEDIRREYYPWWYDQMCKKFGKEKVDELYSFEDCLTDFVVVHWAWEVTE